MHRAMTTHVHEAISQKLELIHSSVIHHWKAYDINVKVGFFLGIPFSLACTQLCSTVANDKVAYIQGAVDVFWYVVCDSIDLDPK